MPSSDYNFLSNQSQNISQKQPLHALRRTSLLTHHLLQGIVVYINKCRISCFMYSILCNLFRFKKELSCQAGPNIGLLYPC